MVPLNKTEYCDKLHPTVSGITCDLVRNHDGSHIHYGVGMNDRDLEWDDAPAWYIIKHGLYICCVEFLQKFLSNPASENMREDAKLHCPKCHATIKRENRTWRWGLQ